ncbi:hypothetical protein FB451DRAFT_1408728 [Mycena latifolia]|nr:hypothetical protein FB451DRAFT_1408728 [Mycena latifolia]
MTAVVGINMTNQADLTTLIAARAGAPSHDYDILCTGIRDLPALRRSDVRAPLLGALLAALLVLSALLTTLPRRFAPAYCPPHRAAPPRAHHALSHFHHKWTPPPPWSRPSALPPLPSPAASVATRHGGVRRRMIMVSLCVRDAALLFHQPLRTTSGQGLIRAFAPLDALAAHARAALSSRSRPPASSHDYRARALASLMAAVRHVIHRRYRPRAHTPRTHGTAHRPCPLHLAPQRAQRTPHYNTIDARRAHPTHHKTIAAAPVPARQVSTVVAWHRVPRAVAWYPVRPRPAPPPAPDVTPLAMASSTRSRPSISSR